jgi:hypothetical protein
MVLAENRLSKGLAMSIRGEIAGVEGGVADVVHTSAIAPAFLPTLIIGLLLLIGP